MADLHASYVIARRGRLAGAWAVALLMLAGCPASPPSPLGQRPNLGLIELASYSDAAVKADPAGGAGRIVGGRILVDFADDALLDEIDAVLARHNLARIGIVGSPNLVTAEITDGRSELDAQAAIKSEPRVEAAPLAYLVEPAANAGETRPILYPSQPAVPETLGVTDVTFNWHHYVMDTFAAHALVEAVLGRPLSDVEIAVVDAGFQKQAQPLPAESLFGDPADTDLVGKTLPPIVVTPSPDGSPPLVRIAELPADVSSNAALVLEEWVDTKVVQNLHGMLAAGAAVGGGQEVLGTGKHCRWRPVKYAFNGEPDSLGRPVAVRSVDHLAAVLTYLDEHASSNLRVINMSLSAPTADARQRRELAKTLRGALLGHELNGRLMIVSAGNELNDAALSLPQELSLPRNPALGGGTIGDILLRMERLMVVTGTRFAPFDPLLALLNLFDPLDASEDRFIVSPTYGSNQGDTASVAAPAQQVAVHRNGLAGVGLESGTSIAAPLVAGLAGELFAVDPTADAGTVLRIIQDTADDLAGEDGAVGWDRYFGFGRINCWKAVLTVLNRAAPDRPKWLGIRIRSALPGISPDEILVDDVRVDGARLKRVRDIERTPDDPLDHVREVPFQTPSPTVRSALFSFEMRPLDHVALGRIPLLRVKTAGAVTYEVPLRLDDLRNARIVDSSLDDFVLTIDPRTPTACLYGRVTRRGAAAADGDVLYVARDGSTKTAAADGDGYYAIYDALPDRPMEVVGRDGQGSVTETITAPAMRATQLNFELEEPEFPWTYRGTANRTVFVEWDFLGGGSIQSTQSLDVEITLWEQGHVAAAMIGASEGVNFGGTETTHEFKHTCPADAPRNAGQLVSLYRITFGPDWPGTYSDNGTFILHNRYPPASDWVISGTFSRNVISGIGSWPDPTRHPRGGRYTIPVSFPGVGCMRTEEPLYYRVEMELTGTRYVRSGSEPRP